MASFSMSFEQRSLKEIAQFAGFRTMMSDEVQAAMKTAREALIAAVQGGMHWKHPTGALEGSIHDMYDSPYEIVIGSELPYSRRREFGYSGFVDRLGRYYPYDPGGFYFLAGWEAEHTHALSLIETAVNHALQRLTGYGY